MLKRRSSRSKSVTRNPKNLVCRKDTKKRLFRITKTLRLLGSTNFEINQYLFVDAVLFRNLASRSFIVALNFTVRWLIENYGYRPFIFFDLKFYLALLIRTRFIAEGWGRCSVPLSELPGASRLIPVSTSSEPKMNGRYGMFLGKGAAWNNLFLYIPINHFQQSFLSNSFSF